jgi:hypothetical protein
MYRHITGLLFALACVSAPIVGLVSAAQADVLEDGRVLLADHRDEERLDDIIRERRDEIRRREREQRSERGTCPDGERRDDRIGDRQNLCEGENPRDRRNNDDDLDDVWDDIRDIFD